MSNINALIHTGDAQETFEAQQSAYLAHQSQHAPSSSSMAARSLAEQVLADTGFEAGQSSQIISQAGHLSLTVSQIRQLGNDEAIRMAKRAPGISRPVRSPDKTHKQERVKYEVAPRKNISVLESFGVTGKRLEPVAARLRIRDLNIKNSKNDRPLELQKYNAPAEDIMNYFEELEANAPRVTPQGS